MLQEAQVVALREAFAKLYQDKMDLIEWGRVMHEDHSTTMEEIKVLEAEPCKIDFDTEPVGQTDKGVVIAPQTITLFVRPDIQIKSGSKIRVTFTDIPTGQLITKEFQKASEPFIYNTHQEIALTLFDKYA